jgi:hypothetical protein
MYTTPAVLRILQKSANMPLTNKAQGSLINHCVNHLRFGMKLSIHGSLYVEDHNVAGWRRASGLHYMPWGGAESVEGMFGVLYLVSAIRNLYNQATESIFVEVKPTSVLVFFLHFLRDRTSHWVRVCGHAAQLFSNMSILWPSCWINFLLLPVKNK